MSDGEKVEVTDKDIEDVLEELRKGRKTEHAHEHAHDHSHEGHDHGAHDHNHNHTHEAKVDAPLPPLDDAFAQSFGDSFKNLDELKSKVGENLKLEKEQKLREKRRTKIMEKLVEEVKADLPDALV